MRLTTKYLESEHYFADQISEDATEEERNKYLYSIITKLGQLEDIEDELGIDLITLFKALKQKVVYHNKKIKIELLSLCIKSNELYLYGFVEDTLHAVFLSLKDYGKTWALTKEELE